jgi:hypothetical protein
MKNIKKLDPEKPEKLIDDITDAEASLHAQLVQAAEEVGKDRERWLALREPLSQAGKEQTTNSEDAEIYLSSIQSLGMYRDKIVSLSGLGNQLGEVDTHAHHPRGASLTIEKLVVIARENEKVELAPEALERIKVCYTIVYVVCLPLA